MKAEVKGADQMRQLLQSFPRRIQRDVINSVAARGATVVKKHAKKNIKQNGSVKSGTLLKSVKTRKKRKQTGFITYTQAGMPGTAILLKEEQAKCQQTLL